MEGGVCGRRAFFGRFILQSFGIPSVPRPQRGHAALAHWTPEGWVVNLGAGWGCAEAKGVLGLTDADFLLETQVRKYPAGTREIPARRVGRRGVGRAEVQRLSGRQRRAVECPGPLREEGDRRRGETGSTGRAGNGTGRGE